MRDHLLKSVAGEWYEDWRNGKRRGQVQLSCQRATRQASLALTKRARVACRSHYGLLFSAPFFNNLSARSWWLEPCQVYAFKKCARWCRWPKCWSCWVLLATSGPATKSVVLAQSMPRRGSRAEASRPTSRGMSTSAFAADQRGTSSTSTQLPRTSPCMQLPSISALVLDVPFRGSKGAEPAATLFSFVRLDSPRNPAWPYFPPRKWPSFKAPSTCHRHR